ncbi:hypothetical protein [Streptomyces axinellae]|uniref:Uncharacterized protein n=1 Tax=Streptomyces axinellae TaxID=552788 RepID=A0ABN3Q283_9ACTN
MGRRALAAAGELTAWWGAMAVLWLMLVQTIDPLECAVGAGAAALAAWAGPAARRAVRR